MLSMDMEKTRELLGEGFKMTVVPWKKNQVALKEAPASCTSCLLEHPLCSLSTFYIYFPKGHSVMDKAFACHTGGQGSNPEMTKDC